MKRVLFAIAICGLLGGAASWAAETDKSATNTNAAPDAIPARDRDNHDQLAELSRFHAQRVDRAVRGQIFLEDAS
jgi:hypothetical protein